MADYLITDHDEDVETLLETYLEWLRLHWGDDELAGVEPMTETRKSYWDWDDGPTIVADGTTFRPDGSRYNRVIATDLSPFHDEGGHALLIGVFTDLGGWGLDHVMQVFDTLPTIIHQEGQLK